MTTPRDIDGWRRALVYGLGISGIAAARLLRQRGVGVIGVDRRSVGELNLADLADDPEVELVLGVEPAELPGGVDGVVVSPGVPLDRPLLEEARRGGIPILGEVELALGYLDGSFVGITGSNGKSTTTALAGELIRAGGLDVEICGNIGVPLASLVDGPPGRIFVTELSSFQLEVSSSLRPCAAAWLNLSPDHLDRHRTLELYAEAKAALFAHQTEEDVAVLNADDPWVAAVATRARRRFFSRLRPVEDGCYLEGETVVEVSPQGQPTELFRCSDLRIPGEHNLENAMAAALLARAVGVGVESLRPGMGRFRGLPHRLELVADRAGITWFDDSKATNIAATLRSLEGFEEGSVLLVLGGRDKGSDPSELRQMVGRKARRVYYIGESAGAFHEVLDGLVPGSIVGTMAAAVAAAASEAEPGNVVLLSPACASFDQYADFEERGRHFQQLVDQLGGVDG
jgi:UDP-N-acetylmuramoylalanine--D-glutamate ligase